MQPRLILFLTGCWVYLRHWRLVKRFVSRLGYFPNPAVPHSSVEKYLWRKLFDHDPRFVGLSDKLQAKDIISTHFPDLKFARTLWQGDDPADIPDAILEGDCVIKANHGCAMNWFVHNGELDREAMEKECRRWMKSRHGKRHHEWAYSGIEPKLFVEEMLVSGDKQIDRDYKFYMCGDQLIYAYVCGDRFRASMFESVFDPDGVSHEVVVGPGVLCSPMATPEHWGKLVDASKALARDFDHVRCDLHEVDGDIWFSELTFYSMAGYEWVDWPEAEERFDALWDIRRSWFLTNHHSGWRKHYAEALSKVLSNAM